MLFDDQVPNIDADGDGKSDKVKVAYWRTVVGNEQVSLPNRPTTTTALRVDAFVVVEITPSSGGSPVRVDLQTSNFYEPGVGIVRVTVPSSVAGRPYDAEDLLVGWDGVTEGRGYITQQEQNTETAQTMGAALSAVALPGGDGVLVATLRGLHRLDRNGVFQANTEPLLFPDLRLLRTGAGIQALSGGWPSVQLHSFNDQGQYLAMTGSVNFANGRPSTINDVGETFAFHTGNPYLWVAWHRTYLVGPQIFGEVVLRAVAPNGSSPFPALTFPTSPTATVSAIHVTVNPGSVLLVWNERDVPGANTARTVGASNTGSVAFDTSPVVLPAQLANNYSAVRSVSDGTTSWLHWTIDRPTGTPGVMTREPYGVMLSAAGQPVGDPSSALLLPTVDAAVVDWINRPFATGGHLLVTGSVVGLTFANDTFPLPMLTYGDYVAGAGPLASTVTKASTYRVALVGPPSSVDIPPFVFSDRVLILSEGNTGGYMRPTVIFR